MDGVPDALQVFPALVLKYLESCLLIRLRLLPLLILLHELGRHHEPDGFVVFYCHEVGGSLSDKAQPAHHVDALTVVAVGDQLVLSALRAGSRKIDISLVNQHVVAWEHPKAIVQVLEELAPDRYRSAIQIDSQNAGNVDRCVDDAASYLALDLDHHVLKDSLLHDALLDLVDRPGKVVAACAERLRDVQ